MERFLGRLRETLGAVPAELIAALWRVLLLLLLLGLHALRCLWRLLRWLERAPQRSHCRELPPHIKRKPDPCLYSQFYLSSLGLAVTWNNPDIWITLPDQSTVVDSYHLEPDTDYVVHARIHDASFDAALATRVRCFYRPWSFNSPDRIPIEFNPDGSEKVEILHIPPWESRVAKFRWHTPNTPHSHYCLQVACYHPDDKNPNNNLGQENTNLNGGSPGGKLVTDATLWNPTGRRRGYRLVADAYSIPEGKITLRLETLERRLTSPQPFAGIRGAMLTRDARHGLVTAARHGLTLTSYVYRGWEEVSEASKRGSRPLPPRWALHVDGEPAEKGHSRVIAEPGENRLSLVLGLRPGEGLATAEQINISAFTEAMQLVGGITIGGRAGETRQVNETS